MKKFISVFTDGRYRIINGCSIEGIEESTEQFKRRLNK